jgi:hypothetical protein
LRTANGRERFETVPYFRIIKRIRHKSSESSFAAPRISPVRPFNFFRKKRRKVKLNRPIPKKTRAPSSPQRSNPIPRAEAEESIISRAVRFSAKGLANPPPDLA